MHKTKNIHAQTHFELKLISINIVDKIITLFRDATLFLLGLWSLIPKDCVIETSKREFEPSLNTILPLFPFVVLRMYTTCDTPIRQVRSPSDLSGQMLKDVKVTRP
jgi:hypothetical protein